MRLLPLRALACIQSPPPRAPTHFPTPARPHTRGALLGLQAHKASGCSRLVGGWLDGHPSPGLLPPLWLCVSSRVPVGPGLSGGAVSPAPQPRPCLAPSFAASPESCGWRWD